jgi:hypothetical protein
MKKINKNSFETLQIQCIDFVDFCFGFNSFLGIAHQGKDLNSL